jgi:FdhD protein
MELPIRRWRRGSAGLERTKDDIAVERTVEIASDGVVIARMQATPRDLEDLAVGFLISQGLVEGPDEVGEAVLSSDGGRVEVALPGAEADALARSVREMSVGSGCGMALFGSEIAKRTEAPRSPGFSADEMIAAVRDVERRGELFKATGCVHAAAAWRGGDLLAFREDIGRHNAVDKVAGACARQGRDLLGALIVTTGRLTAEMAAKVIRLGAWGTASRSAPTDRAVMLAAEFGVVLAGFVRGGRFNLYCGADRLREEGAP